MTLYSPTNYLIKGKNKDLIRYIVEGTKNDESKRNFQTFMEKKFRGHTDIITGERFYPYGLLRIQIDEKDGEESSLIINRSKANGFYPHIKNKIEDLKKEINSSGFRLRNKND